MTTEILGESVEREDAKEKVCGGAVYTDDIYLTGMLHGKVLRSRLPHARIKSVDAGRALKLPGVTAVITGADLKGIRVGHRIKDQPVLADDRVRFYGERVAAVAATEAEIAEAALDLIEVEYEALPAVVDPLEAMQNQTLLLHPEASTYSGYEGDGRSNVASQQVFQKGDLEAGWKMARHVFKREYRTPVVHQGYMEPHSGVVDIRADGEIWVWSNNKTPYRVQEQLAALLGVPINRIRVITPHIGGDFGGKGNLMDLPLAYYLARKTGRPVKITMNREEEFIAASPRHASIINISSGVDKEGNLVVWEARVIFNSGAYASQKPSGHVRGGKRAAGPYRIPHVKIDACCVYTNTVPCGHCRAPGQPQVVFAVESHIDYMAHELGIDPVRFRMQNALREGDLSPTGDHWEDVKAVEVLTRVSDVSGWSQKDKRPTENEGWGVSLVERHIGGGLSSAVVRLCTDGSVVAVIGVADPGTGSRTVLRQIAAYELGLPVSRVKLDIGDTLTAPFDSGSGGSRVTHVAGNAVRLAAINLKKQIQVKLAAHWKVASESVNFKPDGTIYGEANSVTWQEAAALTGPLIGEAVYECRKMKNTCFAAHVVHLSVDDQTGGVQLHKYFAVHDIGRALNPKAVEGQIEGGVVQGIGFALMEQNRCDGGLPVDHTLAEFKMPLVGDVPKIVPILIEGGRSPGPFDAKSIAEIVTTPVASAIANAVFDAVGVRLTRLPLTKEDILAACRLAPSSADLKVSN